MSMNRDNNRDGYASSQSGAALLIFLAIMIILASYTFLSTRPNQTVQQKMNQYSSDNLAKAKEALLAYVVVNGYNNDQLGRFPCPDIDDYEGNAANNGTQASTGECSDMVGRIPYATIQLDTRDAVDGEGNFLWYAVSQNFTRTDVNADTDPDLDSTTEDEVVATIFSPGVSLDGQSRSSVAEMGTYTNYLEQVVEDASTGKPIFPTAAPPADANDRWVTVSRKEIIELVQKQLVNQGKECLKGYATVSGGKYPWAAPMTDTTNFVGVCNTYAGRFPFGGLDSLLPPGCSAAASASLPDCTAEQVSVSTSCDTNTANNNCAPAMLALANCDVSNCSWSFTSSGGTTNIEEAAEENLDTNSCTHGNAAWCTTSQSVITVCEEDEGEDEDESSGAGPDTQMQSTITGMASCDKFASLSNAWKLQMLYHVSQGYVPGGATQTDTGSGNCTVGGSNRCFTLNGGNQDVQAVLIASGEMLPDASPSQTRTDATAPNQYLEGTNLTVFSTTNTGGNYISIPNTSESTTFNDMVVCPSGTGC